MDSNRNARIGANVRKLRKQAGLTQAQLAEDIDCCPAYISRVECGVKGMSVNSLLRLADYFKVSTDSIVSGDERDARLENITRMLDGCSDQMLAYVEQMIEILKSAAQEQSP